MGNIISAIVSALNSFVGAVASVIMAIFSGIGGVLMAIWAFITCGKVRTSAPIALGLTS